MRWLARKIRTFLRMPREEKLLALELAVELARARFELSWLPFRWVAPGLGPLLPAGEEPTAGPEPPGPDLLVARVARVTGILAASLPWSCTCLVQAMAALRVLRRRGRPTRLFLGVRRGAGLEAHAWLTCAGRMVTGGRGHADFIPVGRFGGPS